ncbi:MFS transporter [Nonomuraea africana]|uniref:DHA2 family multidrug resistance protein-like MFS transporter n=1 Tax=Nonomuraea africana TaxID=46171 RepID=A0ABR9KWQ8_9ACTN|nr:MFS transporter [Nonomuraea africana]MBE1566448.1 DHA2 family multidrug resistance protein-like MFS transporter [Nonomuraea africana]
MNLKWGSLAIACLAQLLLAIDLTVLHLALPKLTADLSPTVTQQLWIGDMYGFALAGLLITMGNLGDRIGRKKLLLIGAVAFGVASAVTAYAPSAELLIASRALLGVAGATIMPSTLSIIRNVFTDPAERTMAVGIWSGMGAAGFALGPIVGGLLLNSFWWGSVFLINLPVMALVLVGGVLVLPESRNPHAARIDPASVVLSIVGVVSAVYTLKSWVIDGFAANVAVAALLAVLSLVAFGWRQTRLAVPLVDLRLFRYRAFSGAVGANLFAIFGMIALSLIFAQYMQLVLGWTPLQAGFASLPGGLAGAVGGALAAPLVMRWGRNTVVALGLLMSACSFAVYTQADTTTTFGYLLIGMIVGGLGIGFTFAVTNDTILAAVPKERAGAAAALSETAFELGGSLGIAVLGSILAGAYRDNLVLPAGLPPQVADSLGGALSVADRVPPSVIEAAKLAFVEALQLTALTTTGLLVVLAGVAFQTLRGVPKVIPEDVLAHA